MSPRDWRFYGFVGGSLLAAGILAALLVGGEIAGTRVTESEPPERTQVTAVALGRFICPAANVGME